MLFRRNKIDESIAKNIVDNNDEFDSIASLKSNRFSSANRKKFVQNQILLAKENVSDKKHYIFNFFIANKFKLSKNFLILLLFVMISWSLYLIFFPYFINGSNNVYFSSIGDSLKLTLNGLLVSVFWLITIIYFIVYMIFLNKKLGFFLYFKDTIKIKTKVWKIISIIFIFISLAILLLLLYFPPATFYSPNDTKIFDYWVSHIRPIMSASGAVDTPEQYIPFMQEYLKLLGYTNVNDLTTFKELYNKILNLGTMKPFLGLPSAIAPGISLLYTNVVLGSMSTDYSIIGIILITIFSALSIVGFVSWFLLELYNYYKVVLAVDQENQHIEINKFINWIKGSRNSIKEKVCTVKSKFQNRESRQSFKQYKRNLKSKGLDTDTTRFTTSTDDLSYVDAMSEKNNQNVHEQSKNAQPEQQHAQSQNVFYDRETNAYDDVQHQQVASNQPEQIIPTTSIQKTNKMSEKIKISDKRLGKFLKKKEAKKKKNKAEIEVPDQELEDIFKNIDI